MENLTGMALQRQLFADFVAAVRRRASRSENGTGQDK